MKAAIFVGPGKPFEIRDYPPPAAQPGKAVVRLVASGLCGTDLHIWEGAIAMPAPIILGHEFLGYVQDLGTGEHQDCRGQAVRPGDLVAVNVIAPCGECLLCRTGGDASCLRLGESLTYVRSVETPPHFHGGFAEVTVAPIAYLHRLPEGLPAMVAASCLCAGPTVIRGLRYAGGIIPGEHVVVQGSGPVGLFAALYAAQMGAGTVTLIGSGTLPLRLEVARELGAGLVLDIRATTREQRRQAVLEATGGQGADLAIEASGNPEAVAEGLPLLRPRGRYVWAGQYSDRGEIALPPHLVTFNALQIMGSAQFTAQDRADYFDFLLRTPAAWNALTRAVTDRVPVSAVNEAFARARAGLSLKTVFVPDAVE